MKIAIEGMDGSGKTSVAKAVSKLTGYKYLERPMENFWGLDKNTYDSMCRKMWDMNDPDKTLWFFGLGHLLAVSGEENQNVILDRHILSTYFWDGNENNQHVFQSLVNCGVLPDLTIILYANVETRINRIRARDSKDEDLTLDKVTEYGYDKMLEFAEHYQMPYIMIDTEKLNMEEVINVCANIILEFSKLSDEEIITKSQEYDMNYGVQKAKQKVKSNSAH